jgi:hypothetical protein
MRMRKNPPISSTKKGSEATNLPVQEDGWYIF